MLALLTIALSSLAGAPAIATAPTEPATIIRLENLSQGVVIRARRRLHIADIRIGQISVKRLFHYPPPKPLAWRDYYRGHVDDIRIVARDQHALDELRRLILPKPLGTIIIELRDDRQSFVRRLYRNKWNSPRFAEERQIIVSPDATLCDGVTRIVYTKIDPVLRRELQRIRQTAQEISLEDIFEILVRDEIDPFLDRLDPDRQDPCSRSFHLLSWIKNEEAPGFEYEQYRIHDELQRILGTVAATLGSLSRDWEQSRLQVRVIGYTDADEVVGIALKAEATGIAKTGALTDPIRVHFGGCRNDRREREAPVYVDIDGMHGRPVGMTINDNCELGAVRAFVAAHYLRNKTGDDKVEFSYATGGISDAASDALKRKVDLSISVKAARSDGG